MTQPVAMRTTAYLSGVEKLDGHDAWTLFEACARGDMATAKALVAKDRRLVNAQYWYRFPLHMAVFAGNAELVALLLENGADPGQSIYTYDSWDKLLRGAHERGYRAIETLLERAMQKRFNYSPEFDVLKDAIIARDARQIAAVLRRRPHLTRASDALGNNPLHWSVITRQLGLIERFVELGTPIDARRADGNTPVLLAVNGANDYWYRATRGRSHPSLRNSSVLVGSLLAQGAEYTISVAAAVGDQERVEQLIARDAGLARRRDSARICPLSYAASEGHLHIVRLLLEHGADPNLPEDAAPRGRALYEACAGNHFEIAELLLQRGADPNAGVDSCECCLTIGRIRHGPRAKPLEQLLRKHGAVTPPYRMSVNKLKQAIRDHDAVTHHEEFFDTVLARRDTGLFELYLDRRLALTGATASERSESAVRTSRSAPAQVARQSRSRIRKNSAEASDRGILTNSATAAIPYPGSPSLVRRLLDSGLDPNQPDWLGRTMLHTCAATGDTHSAALLLAAGADINARDIEFRGTPLAAAVRAWCEEEDAEQMPQRRRMVEFLLERGAATNLPGDEPWATPLQCARGELVEMLKEHGAT